MTSEISETIGLRADATAKLLGIGRTTFLALHKSGRLPRPRRLGRAIVWDKRELLDWFAAGVPERSRWEVGRNRTINIDNVGSRR